MPDEKNWQELYKKLIGNPNVDRIASQVGLPPLEGDENIRLFFSVLGDRGNKLGKEKELAEVLGFSPKKTKLIMSTLRDVLKGESWGDLRENNDIRRGGWHPER